MRADLIKGDHRCLYFGWLRSIQGAVYEGDIQEDDVEPPVPAGLRTLSQPLECFANFLGIDFDLIAAAAEQSQDESQMGISSSEILTWVRGVPETEKDLSSRESSKTIFRILKRHCASASSPRYGPNTR